MAERVIEYGASRIVVCQHCLEPESYHEPDGSCMGLMVPKLTKFEAFREHFAGSGPDTVTHEEAAKFKALHFPTWGPLTMTGHEAALAARRAAAADLWDPARLHWTHEDELAAQAAVTG